MIRNREGKNRLEKDRAPEQLGSHEPMRAVPAAPSIACIAKSRLEQVTQNIGQNNIRPGNSPRRSSLTAFALKRPTGGVPEPIGDTQLDRDRRTVWLNTRPHRGTASARAACRRGTPSSGLPG